MRGIWSTGHLLNITIESKNKETKKEQMFWVVFFSVERYN